MYPLKNRRHGTSFLALDNEYDVQDLLHAMLRPWINDIRPEEYTPSCAGENLLVIENVLVISCSHCGESYLAAETLYEIERIKQHRQSLAEPRSVPVTVFA